MMLPLLARSCTQQRAAVLLGRGSFKSPRRTATEHSGLSEVGKPSHSTTIRGKVGGAFIMREKKSPEFDYLNWGCLYYVSVYVMRINTVCWLQCIGMLSAIESSDICTKQALLPKVPWYIR